MPNPLGVARGNIELRDYDPAWAELFEQEKALLATVFGDFPIEHIGSTSIPGLRSKPILDIMVAMNSIDVSDSLKQQLAAVGYEYRKNFAEQQHHFLWKLEDGLQTVFLKLTLADTDFWRNNIIFRDRLRSSPDLLMQYQQLKDSLASEVGEGNRPEYTRRKGEFIQAVIDGSF